MKLFQYVLIIIFVTIAKLSLASNISFNAFTDFANKGTIEIILEKGWKIYYPYSGHFGEETKFFDTKGNQLKVKWPTPKRFTIEDTENFGYEDKIILSVDNLKNNELIKAQYFICNKICVGQERKFYVKQDNSLLLSADKPIVKINNIIEGSYYLDEGKVIALIPKPENGEYIDVILHDRKLVTKNFQPHLNHYEFQILFPGSYNENEIINELKKTKKILLINENEQGSLQKVSLKLSVKEANQSFLYILLIAFIGGFILNLMPCVLPVVVMKINSVVKSKFTSKQEIFFIMLGIIFSFLILSILAISTKKLGNNIGWGFHFQNPYFILTLAIITLVLSLSGFKIIKLKTPGIFNIFGYNNSKYVNAFLSGSLATALSTPCTAPFLGSALAFTISATYFDIFTVFMAIALGFSLPYIILLISPNWLKSFSKLNRFSSIINFLMALSLLITGLWFSYIFVEQKFPKLIKQENEEKIWHEFNEEKILKLVNEGHIVFVDIKARWCLTCYFNKINVLEDKEVMQAFRDKNIYLMQADITSKNVEIDNYLIKHGRSGIPFNAIYSQHYNNKLHAPLILNEILDKYELLTSLK